MNAEQREKHSRFGKVLQNSFGFLNIELHFLNEFSDLAPATNTLFNIKNKILLTKRNPKHFLENVPHLHIRIYKNTYSLFQMWRLAS